MNGDNSCANRIIICASAKAVTYEAIACTPNWHTRSNSFVRFSAHHVIIVHTNLQRNRNRRTYPKGSSTSPKVKLLRLQLQKPLLNLTTASKTVAASSTGSPIRIFFSAKKDRGSDQIQLLATAKAGGKSEAIGH